MGANLKPEWTAFMRVHHVTTLDDFIYVMHNVDWTKRYNLIFDFVLEPSQQLRARVYREFKKGTILNMKKVRSVLIMAQPKPSESIALRDGLPLQLEKEVAINLMSVTGYYFALRVLAHAWTYLVQVDRQSFLFMDCPARCITATKPSRTPWSSAMGACSGSSAMTPRHVDRWPVRCGYCIA